MRIFFPSRSAVEVSFKFWSQRCMLPVQIRENQYYQYIRNFRILLQSYFLCISVASTLPAWKCASALQTCAPTDIQCSFVQKSRISRHRDRKTANEPERKRNSLNLKFLEIWQEKVLHHERTLEWHGPRCSIAKSEPNTPKLLLRITGKKGANHDAVNSVFVRGNHKGMPWSQPGPIATDVPLGSARRDSIGTIKTERPPFLNDPPLFGELGSER